MTAWVADADINVKFLHSIDVDKNVIFLYKYAVSCYMQITAVK